MTFQKEAFLKVQNYLKQHKIAALLLPLTDPFGSEYVCPHYNFFPWMTGFTGSTGLVCITPEKSALFVDGRYTLQAKNQIDPHFFDIIPYEMPRLKDWIPIQRGKTIYYDPWLFSAQQVDTFEKTLFPLPFQPLKENPVLTLWPQRTAQPASQIHPFPIEYAGLSFGQKSAQIWQKIYDYPIETLLLSNPLDICWLLNIRGNDIAHVPVVLSYALLHKKGNVDLFVHTPENCTNFTFETTVKVYPLSDFASHLKTEDTIGFDPAETPMAIKGLISTGTPLKNPCPLLKSVKNSVEIKKSQHAQEMDGVAMVNFLCWLEKTLPHQSITETEAAEKLNGFRKANPTCKDLSFETISGLGPNGALIHGRPSLTPLKMGEIYLVDSGGQYLQGTTDVTRTIALGGKPTDHQKDIYTRVLKGFLRLIRAHFPADTPGSRLDALARYDLWQIHQDYAHGTGHGVGQYLSVHEGPASISPRSTTPLMPGMIVSNEPGCYLEGKFGVRIENLMVVRSKGKIGNSEKEILGFENLTLVPLDSSLVLFEMLDNSEKEWIKTYHQTILKTLSPYLSLEEKDWLETACEGFL